MTERSTLIMVALMSVALPVTAQVDIGVIEYRAVTDTPLAPNPVPAMPTWSMALITALVAVFGFFAERTYRGVARLLSVFVVGIAITAGATIFRSGPVQAQQSYDCGNFEIDGTVNITDPDEGATNFQYDPSAAIAACAQILLTPGPDAYAGPGTLTATAVITFTVTNVSGVALELDPARITDEAQTTSVDNYQAGGQTFNYTDVLVTPSNAQSQCGDLLQDGASCEVTVDVATTGDLAV